MTLSRRGLLRAGAAAGLGAALAGTDLLDWAQAWAAEQPFQPEPGAHGVPSGLVLPYDELKRLTTSTPAPFCRSLPTSASASAAWYSVGGCAPPLRM